jgi:transposase-like protein
VAKYTPAKKAEALVRMSEIGVQKTSEELNISVQTLYKWRNEDQNGSARVAQAGLDADALLQVIQNEELHATAVKRLEDEAARLKEENSKLRQENGRLRVAVKAFIG